MENIILTGIKGLNIWEEVFKHDLTLKSRNPFKSYCHPSWVKSTNYITIPNRKELIHGDFGKDKIPYFPIRGSIVGDCINLKDKEWKNGMSYEHFRKYILKVDLTKTIQNYDYLIEFFKQIIINNKMSKQINKTEFISDIKSEMTKAQLMTKYELPASVVSKFVKDLGLKLKRDVQPKYVLVDDNENQVDTYPGATNM